MVIIIDFKTPLLGISNGLMIAYCTMKLTNAVCLRIDLLTESRESTHTHTHKLTHLPVEAFSWFGFSSRFVLSLRATHITDAISVIGTSYDKECIVI